MLFRNFYLLFLPVSCLQINFHSVIKNSAAMKKFFFPKSLFAFRVRSFKQKTPEKKKTWWWWRWGEVGQTFPGGDRAKSFHRKVFSLADPKVLAANNFRTRRRGWSVGRSTKPRARCRIDADTKKFSNFVQKSRWRRNWSRFLQN